VIKSVLVVGFGGGIGSVFRYVLSLLLGKLSGFPYSTFFVNILGCFIIGIFAGFSENHQCITQNYRLLLITGLCGGFTTFSAFTLENIKLLESGRFFSAILYTSLSIILGLVFTFVGIHVSK